MICAAAKLFLFVLTVVATSGDEFKESEDLRSLPPQTVTSAHSSLAATSSYFRQNHFQKQKENQKNFPVIEETYIKQRNGTLDSLENEISFQKFFKTDLKFFFKEVKICRNSHSYMSNEVFKQKLYCFLLDKLNGITKKNLEENFRCNISDKTVDQLKDMKNLMELFRRIFKLKPQNDSCETSREPTIGSQIDAIGVENLKLKLGDEWISLKPKVSHLSHIYLGTSVYPILTEESWVIENDHTSKSAASTKSFYKKETKHNKKEVESQTKRATKIYQLLAPIHCRKDPTKNANEPCSSRSLYAVTPKSLISKRNLEKKFDTQNAYNSNLTAIANEEFFNSNSFIYNDRTERTEKNDVVHPPQDKHKTL